MTYGILYMKTSWKSLALSFHKTQICESRNKYYGWFSGLEIIIFYAPLQAGDTEGIGSSLLSGKRFDQGFFRQLIILLQRYFSKSQELCCIQLWGIQDLAGGYHTTSGIQLQDDIIILNGIYGRKGCIKSYVLGISYINLRTFNCKKNNTENTVLVGTTVAKETAWLQSPESYHLGQLKTSNLFEIKEGKVNQLSWLRSII